MTERNGMHTLDRGANGAFQPIAIVGMGCLFPRAANCRMYWSNIKKGVDAISEVPATHWNPDDYFNADPKALDQTYSRRGGFLDAVEFNPMEFGIAPKDLDAIDTSQLLGLVAAKQALIDAGYGPDRPYDKGRVSVILGVTGTLELVIPLGARLGHPRWRKAMEEAGIPKPTADWVCQNIGDSYVGWQENSFPGLLGNVVAGRISNRLDLGGTNCVVDAACASSLSAIHLASLELAAGRSDMVVSGGIDTFNDIFMFMCFSKTPALSPSGNARPFDANGDGTTIGEGLGIVILKRLEDAQRDGDRIYAVIKGIGSSSDGKGNAIYAPSSEGQKKALKNAYRMAGISPATVELVEAHGTGTKVGDAAEIGALADVFREANPEGRWCAVGSVKSQIGHTKAAAGAAGLIKAALALHHKILPPTIKIDTPLPQLANPQSPVYANTQSRPWIANTNHPRRAGVSAFGFGGSNFHCVLEEYESARKEIDWDGEVEIVAASADSREELKKTLASWQQSPPRDLARLAADSRHRFDVARPFRLLLVVERGAADLPQLAARALRFLEEKANEQSWFHPEGIAFGSGSGGGQLAFLFPGQGSQRVGMLRDLACQFPQMQDALFEANGILCGDDRLSDVIYPFPALDKAALADQELSLRRTEYAQPALGAIEVGALRILEYFGLKADALAGHSFGELVALHAGGVFDASALFQLAGRRGQLMGQLQSADAGAMLAVFASRSEVEEWIQQTGLALVIANHNGPSQIVVSGSKVDIETLQRHLSGVGKSFSPLPVAAAFHSSFVASAQAPFRAAISEVPLHGSSLPVYSNSTAEIYPIDPSAMADLLAAQIVRPVRFVEEIEALYSAGVRTFVEVGPGTVLSRLADSILAKKSKDVLALDSSNGKQSGLVDLAILLARLAAAGHPVQLHHWEKTDRPSVEPAATKPGFTVAICGANYTKPPSPTAPPPKLQLKSTEASNLLPFALPSPDHTVNSHPEPNRQPGSGPPAGYLDALQLTQQSLIAFQKLQEETARLHRQFLEQQEAAQKTLQALVEQQQRLLSGGLPPLPQTRTPGNQYYPDPAEIRRPVEPPPLPKATMPELSAPAAIPAPAPAYVPPAPVAVSHKPLFELPPVPNTMLAISLTDFANSRNRETLLEVVAEKTGYPKEMLGWEMALDTDLGIDSIKRVEILSALQERMPQSPVVKPEHLGSLHTLEDIAKFLDAVPGRVHSYAEPVPAPPLEPATPKKSDSASEERVRQTLLSVVAEKTGYPAEMLGWEMALDTDLGIDSIKRVEILSALQERLPEAPPVQPEHLGTLHTLSDIAGFLSRGKGNGRRETATSNSAGRSPNPSLAALAEEGDADDDFMAMVEKALPRKNQETPPPPPVEVLPVLSPDFMDDGPKSVFGDFLNQPSPRPIDLSAIRNSMNAASAQPNAASDVFPRPAKVSSALELSVNSIFPPSDAEFVDIYSPPPPEPVVQIPEPAAVEENESTSLLFGLPAFDSDLPEPPTQTIFGNKNLPETPLAPHGPRLIDRSVLMQTELPKTPRKKIQLHHNSVVWLIAEPSSLTVKIAQGLDVAGYRPIFIAWNDSPFAYDPHFVSGLILFAPEGKLPSDLPGRAFRWIKHLGASLQDAARRGGALLATITRLDGAFGTLGMDGTRDPLAGALAGLLKTAALEWPAVNCKAIDVEPSNVRALIPALLEELTTAGPLEVGITSVSRTTLILTPGDAMPLAPWPISEKDTLIVTGGARGVTAEVAVEIARALKPKIVLLGRTKPSVEPDWLVPLKDEARIKGAIAAHMPPNTPLREIGKEYQRIQAEREIERNLARIREAGSPVSYVAVDVRSADSVEKTIAEIRASHGPIAGLIHGAGVIEDKLIEELSDEQFNNVFETKALGFRNLWQSLRGEALRLVVLFSSSTGRFGRRGQAAYAAANEVLNKYAEWITTNRPDVRAMAINWGPWDGGMVTPGLAKLFAEEGVGLISLKAGSQFLLDELRSLDRAVEVVAIAAAPHKPMAEVAVLEPPPAPIAPEPVVPSKIEAPLTQSTTEFSLPPELLKTKVEPKPGDAEKPTESKVGTRPVILIPPHSKDLSLVFERNISLADHRILRSHVINGKSVLPMALHMEWAAYAAAQRHADLHFFGFNDFRILQGLQLEPGQASTIRVFAGPSVLREGITMVPVEIHGFRDGKEVIHSRTEAVLAANLPTGEPAGLPRNLQAYSPSIEDAYGERLFHGEALAGLQAIDGISASAMLGSCHTAPPPINWMAHPVSDSWILDPLAIDGAFQMMILWTLEQYGAPSLPCLVGRYRQYEKSFPQGNVQISIRISRGNSNLCRADIDFIDADRKLIARIQDGEFVIDRALKEKFRNNHLASLALG